MRLWNATLLAALTLLPGALSAGDRDTETSEADRIHFEHDVKPGQLLDIDLDTGGGIRIRTWDKNLVRVSADPLGDRCPDAVLSFDHTPRGVLLESEYERHPGNHHSCSFAVEIQVPRKFDVRIRSAGGQISIDGLHGRVEGRTGGGQIQLDHVSGKVDLSTGGGQIRVRDCDLDGRLSTGGGQVRFENVIGDVRATSGSEDKVVRGKPRA
jgi:hypothetical protein